MYGNSVSFRDYEGIQGFGIGSASEVEELNKALSAGYDRPPATQGGALRVESLEATLRTVTFTLQNIKLWPKIPKLPAFSTVEEYNILSNYGGDNGVFTNEGDLPETQDADYERKTALVKFLGTTREVTHPMTLVRPAHGNVTALETQNGAIWLVERLERALFHGRSDVTTQEFDGIEKQMLDGASLTDPWGNDPVAAVNPIVVDMRGANLTEDKIEEGANLVVENYGTPTGMYLAPRANSDLAKQFYPRERVNLPYPTEGKVGIAINSVVTNAGLVSLNPDVFLRSGRNNGVKTPPTAASSAKAPNAPASATGVAAVDAASKFAAGDAGTYIYRVTAINRYGESAAVDSAGIAIAAGEKNTLTITDGGGTYAATGYKIYRTGPGGAVSTATVMINGFPRDAATTDFVDFNFWLPGTSRGYMLQENLQFFSFRQLAPMIKIPLATIAASIRWMQLLYGTPIVYAPRKGIIFINVKDD